MPDYMCCQHILPVMSITEATKCKLGMSNAVIETFVNASNAWATEKNPRNGKA